MVRDIVIVGGGTAGWMTATHLRTTFGDRVSITLVESERVGTIGVGEATFSTIRHFFAHLGLSEQDWMPQCNATYKLAIRFENWHLPGQYFYHPFEHLHHAEGFSLADWWLKRYADRDGRDAAFDTRCFVMPAVCESMRAPRSLDGELLPLQRADGGTEPQFPYAYQFDADLLARYLCAFGVRRGVRHVRDDVVAVNRSGTGGIASIGTREHGEIRGDLFIDCTGFRSLLLGQALGEPFESYQDSLPNNRAVALRVPTDPERHGIRPYTTATAMPAGWMWTIPLFERNGMGYVYSDEFCEPEEAEAELRRMAGPAAADLPANHIRMRVGRSRRSWVDNCVAVGLSSGFVEPLESTGIFFIQYAIEQLVEHFPGGDRDSALVDSYNQRVARCFDGVREFLVLHYRGAARADTPYWKATKERAVPDGLAERLRLWSARLPDSETVYPYFHGFEPYSWVVMLLGLGGCRPARYRPVLDALDGSAAARAFQWVGASARRLAGELPSQYEYLSRMHG